LNENYVADTLINRQHPNWFEIADYNNVFEERSRQIMKWQFRFNLHNVLVSQMMDKFRDSVHNSFKINYSYSYLLRNIETNKTLVWFQDRQKRPWFATHGNAQAWLERNSKKKDGWVVKTLTDRIQNLCLKSTRRSKLAGGTWAMKKIRSMYSLKALFYANHFCQQCKALCQHVRSACVRAVSKQHDIN